MQPGTQNSRKGNGLNKIFSRLLLNRSLVVKLALVLALLSCIVYANTLQNDYAMDDVSMITDNNYVKQGIAGIPVLFTTTHMKGAGANFASDDYRPLSLAMFALEYQFFGLNPAVGHFFNILVFAACVVVLFLFLNKFFNGERIIVAFIAALLFAVHPIHTEVVANIKSRDELLSFFFAFLALNLFMGYTKHGKAHQLIAGSLCFFLAIISKETAATLMAIIPFVFFFRSSVPKKRAALITACAAGSVVIFLVIWAGVQHAGHSGGAVGLKLTGNMQDAPGLVSRIAPDILILGYHLKLMFIPYPLNFNYSFREFANARFGDLEVLLSLIAYLSMITVCVKRFLNDRNDPWAFGILFYLVTISIFSNIPFLLGQSMANRYAFFPSVGYCIVSALAFQKWVLRNGANDISVMLTKRSLLVLVPVLTCYAVMTAARNTDWKDNYTLVNADMHKSAEDYTMQYKAGLELQNKYDVETDSIKRMQINEESIQHFSRSLALNPSYSEAHADIGVAYLREKNYDSAEFHFKRTLELNPEHLNAATNLGTLYLTKNQFPEAILYYEKVVRIDPKADMAWYNMGISFARIKQYDSSVRCMMKVIEISPQLDHYKSYGNVAIMYKMMGNLDSARKYEQITKQYYPDFKLQ